MDLFMFGCGTAVVQGTDVARFEIDSRIIRRKKENEMRFNNSIKKLAISALAIVMLLGFGQVTEANALGSYDDDDDRREYRRDDDRDDRRGRDRDRDGRHRRYSRQEIYRIALQIGYRDGLSRGYEERRFNRRSDYNRSHDYRDGMRGFRSEYGDRIAFQQGYREGFRRGFFESYRHTSGNNRWFR
jgi:hypothetical protein